MVATDSGKEIMLELSGKAQGSSRRERGARNAGLGLVKAKLECDHAHINDRNLHGTWQGYARRQC